MEKIISALLPHTCPPSFRASTHCIRSNATHNSLKPKSVFHIPAIMMSKPTPFSAPYNRSWSGCKLFISKIFLTLLHTSHANIIHSFRIFRMGGLSSKHSRRSAGPNALWYSATDPDFSSLYAVRITEYRPSRRYMWTYALNCT
jgi:hypothetical protein